MLTNEPRTVDEAYSSACTTSDLRVEEDRRSDADLLIAAGWNESRVGGALLRLVSEWHGVPKPTKPTRRQIAAMAEDLFRQSKGKDKSLKACSAQATDSAWEWYSDELERVASRLRTLPAVRAQVAHRAKLWSIEPADTVAMQAIGWWLIQRCEPCTSCHWVPGPARRAREPGKWSCRTAPQPCA